MISSPAFQIPLAVLGCIFGVTVLYILAALALVGMVPSLEDPEAGFSEAFKERGWIWASNLVAVGELVTLPLVVLVSLLAQPRLQYAMAEDGLLPKVFSELDSDHNLFKVSNEEEEEAICCLWKIAVLDIMDPLVT